MKSMVDVTHCVLRQNYTPMLITKLVIQDREEVVFDENVFNTHLLYLLNTIIITGIYMHYFVLKMTASI